MDKEVKVYTLKKGLFDLNRHTFAVMEEVDLFNAQEHRHDFYQVQYVYSGVVSEKINRQHVEVQPDTVIIMNPNTVHALEKSSPNSGIFSIAIDESTFIREFFHYLSDDNKIKEYIDKTKRSGNVYSEYLVFPKLKKEIRNILSEIYEEYMKCEDSYENNIAVHLILLFNKLNTHDKKRESIHKDFHKDQRRMNKIQQYMEENYKSITLQALADYIHLHPNYLSTFIKRHTRGKNFNQLLTDIRMKKIEKLLIDTDKSIEEIALLTGYKNTNYFYRIFKNYHHVTPKVYREKLRRDENASDKYKNDSSKE